MAKEKARVREKVDGLADELIALYAQRMKQPGFAFAPDSELQMEFEQGSFWLCTDARSGESSERNQG